ncbi:MAG: alkaline phosphatase family protein [Candidatus Thorarchaeota archaeon]|nr:MAG: alkaline phosphatase family protein [Candidatus Thorarchaeota archaeon]
MSSILRASGVESPYVEMEHDSLANLNDSDSIVLLILDGLGYKHLVENGSRTFLKENLKGSITSVFPPSTSSAVTTYMTGLAPQQHAVTGWWMYLREYGIVSRIMPFSSVINYDPLGTDISNVLNVRPLTHSARREYSIISTANIIDSEFSRFMAGDGGRVGYSEMEGLFTCIEAVLGSSDNRKYVYAYWPSFDEVSHIVGNKSDEAKEILGIFDNALREFVEKLGEHNVTLVITSDHGFVDVEKDNFLSTKGHPKLEECLSHPICGDTRTSFCYVRPFKVDDFERYVSKNLSDACHLFRSDELVRENWFGLYEPNPRLHNRIGDYAMVYKENYAMVSLFPGSEMPGLVGHHGGASEDEMLVPLIVIEG